MSRAGQEPGMDRLRRVEALYHQVVGRPASEREAALLAACPDDAEIRAQVQSLLAQPDSAAGFLSSPAIAFAAASASKSSPSLTGRRIGAFEVRELLGVGGMGEVYRARDSKLGRDVAIKPGNIKLRPDGAVKVLDFGLAKATGPRIPLQATRRVADADRSGDQDRHDPRNRRLHGSPAGPW